MTRETTIPFDPEIDSVYCSFCGTKLEVGGHLRGIFLLCPNHGEFTIAPLVERDPTTGAWQMVTDPTTAGMWETCKVLDSR